MGNEQLLVSCGNTRLVLDMNRPLIRLGRDPEADLAVRDRRCSRQHASIERRLDRIVLVDRSTNGTFVRLDDNVEIWVRHREFQLSGSGQLSLGVSSAEPGAEIVTFQVERRAIQM
jgi:predicted component of type VI protein secretion system